MSPLEDDKQVKREKGLTFLTPNKLSTRHSALLAQIKTKSNSYKLENEIGQILYLLHRHIKITKKVYNNLSSRHNNGKKYDCDKRSQNFLF